MIHKLSGIIEKQEKALDVLTVKIIHLEMVEDDVGTRLNNHSYCLGVLESPQPVRELRPDSLVLDLILSLLGSLCPVSSGVWYHAVFSRMASYSSFCLI
jgi:hypothetical protein